MDLSKNPKIQVAVDLKASDYRRGLFWHEWKRQGGVLFVCFFIAPPIVFHVVEDKLTLYIFLTSLLIIAAISVYFTFFKQAEDLEKDSEPSSYIFDPNGLEAESKSASSTMNWKVFHKVHETKSDFIFLPHKNMFFIVPKRFFVSERQINDLKEMIKCKMADKAVLRK